MSLVLQTLSLYLIFCLILASSRYSGIPTLSSLNACFTLTNHLVNPIFTTIYLDGVHDECFDAIDFSWSVRSPSIFHALTCRCVPLEASSVSVRKIRVKTQVSVTWEKKEDGGVFNTVKVRFLYFTERNYWSCELHLSDDITMKTSSRWKLKVFNGFHT